MTVVSYNLPYLTKKSISKSMLILPALNIYSLLRGVRYGKGAVEITRLFNGSVRVVI